MYGDFDWSCGENENVADLYTRGARAGGLIAISDNAKKSGRSKGENFDRSIHDLIRGVILHYMHLRALSIQMSGAVTGRKMPVDKIGSQPENVFDRQCKSQI